jgi:hypothetical protein
VRIAQHRLDRAMVHRLLREFQVLEKSRTFAHFRGGVFLWVTHC